MTMLYFLFCIFVSPILHKLGFLNIKSLQHLEVNILIDLLKELDVVGSIMHHLHFCIVHLLIFNVDCNEFVLMCLVIDL